MWSRAPPYPAFDLASFSTRSAHTLDGFLRRHRQVEAVAKPRDIKPCRSRHRVPDRIPIAVKHRAPVSFNKVYPSGTGLMRACYASAGWIDP